MGKGSAAGAAPRLSKLLALPWRKSEERDNDWLDDYGVECPGSAVYRFIIGANGDLVGIAYADGAHDGASKEVNQRAALMLAAGDLLSVAKAFAALRNSGLLIEGDAAVSTVLDQADAAIAKGETP